MKSCTFPSLLVFNLKKPSMHFIQPKNLSNPSKGTHPAPIEHHNISSALNTRLNQLFDAYQRNRKSVNKGASSSLSRPGVGGAKEKAANRRVLSAQSKHKPSPQRERIPDAKVAKGKSKNHSLKAKRQSAYPLNASKKYPFQQKANLLLTERAKGTASAQNLRPLDSITNSLDKKQKKEEKPLRNKLKKILEAQTSACKFPKAKHLKAVINMHSSSKPFYSSRPNIRSNSKDNKSEDSKRVIKIVPSKKMGTTMITPRLSTSNTMSKLTERSTPCSKCTSPLLLDSLNGRVFKVMGQVKQKNAPIAMINKIALQTKEDVKEFPPPKKLNKVDKSREALIQWILDCTFTPQTSDR
eukprot:TRINITY_DN2093_c0_g1_i17.p1 TRINITY_DN2093_c0_g1~~TRINITY_DN2093_c0_g1_i17.p1  ORF type:complete len:354 (+),score=80.02 TRINITY_DN2093_c0_g1_i17:101-1162(+)